MKVAIGCDHRGYEAKRRLMSMLRQMGCVLTDFGCEGVGNVDYPDFALLVGQAVAEGHCEAGILLDGSGIGMSIAANKVHGVRAALIHDEITCRRAREHHHCNVLCLGTDLLGEDQIRNIVRIFLETAFENGRHQRRIEKICGIEKQMLEAGLAMMRISMSTAEAQSDDAEVTEKRT